MLKLGGMDGELDSMEVHPPGDLEWLGVVPAGESHLETWRRRSDHPQDQRQDVSHPAGQMRGQSGLREEAVSFSPLSAPAASQSVSPPHGSLSTAELVPFFAAAGSFCRAAGSFFGRQPRSCSILPSSAALTPRLLPPSYQASTTSPPTPLQNAFASPLLDSIPKRLAPNSPG
jgi:hypothetical protein